MPDPDLPPDLPPDILNGFKVLGLELEKRQGSWKDGSEFGVVRVDEIQLKSGWMDRLSKGKRKVVRDGGG